MRQARPHTFRALGATVAALSLVVAGALAAPSADDGLAAPDPAVALRPAVLPDVESVACADCHADVAAEWASTAHAVAWIDEHYRAALAERKRPDLCAGCHVPRPLLADGELARRPKPRDEADAAEPRAHGITCRSCHLGEGDVVLGPRGAETEAHPTERSPFMTAERSSELCAACHRTNIGPVVGIAKDYPDSRAAAEGVGCVDCHMRPVERAPAASGDGPAEAGAATRPGRSHALQTPRDPAFLRRTFALAWSADGERTTVAVQNRAGHRVPGLRGREIRFELEAFAGGESLGSAEVVLDARAYLPVDGEESATIRGVADRVQVRGLHLDPRADEPVEFLSGDVARAE